MLTDIRLIGIIHFDPCGREKIERYLEAAKQEGYFPDIIATEWDKSHFEQVVSQRECLYQRLLNDKYTTNVEEARLMADSMGFEADSHLKVYPDLPIIWLDEGRKVPQENLDHYAAQRFGVLSCHRQMKNGRFDIESTRRKLLETAKTNDDDILDERNSIFAMRVKEAVERGASKIVCIVGLKHTDTKTDGLFGRQLVDAGFNVSVFDTTSD